MAGAALSIDHVTWRHASRSTPVLRDLCLRVAPGERVLLTGASGAGKSTLLAALAGVLGEEGELRGTIDTGGATVGMVLQDPDSQVIASRVGDDVAFGCENLLVPREEIWPRVHRALNLVGLDLPLDHPTAMLSGGQKQRLALAGVIAMGAELILLDEPTANLDPAGREEVLAAIDQVVAQTGATLIAADHRHQQWLGRTDRILALEDGAVREITAAELPRPVSVPSARRASGEPLLWAEDLLTRWGPPRTFSVPRGASTVLVGPNGAGKTTLALTLAGLLPPRGGQLHLAPQLSQGLSTAPHKWKSKELASRIAMVSQDPEHHFVGRTVTEELLVGATEPERVGEVLEQLRLSHLAEASPFSLSGGEKRRLSVGAALVASPRLLILDEPTFGQDEQAFAGIVTLLRHLVDEGLTLVSISHDEEYLAAMGDHIVEVHA